MWSSVPHRGSWHISLHWRLGPSPRELLTRMTRHLSLHLVFSLLPYPHVKAEIMFSSQNSNLVCKWQLCDDQI